MPQNSKKHNIYFEGYSLAQILQLNKYSDDFEYILITNRYRWDLPIIQTTLNDLTAIIGDNYQPHFFGGVILSSVPNNPQHECSIISGQQRILTGAIFLRAIYHSLLKIAQELYADDRSVDTSRLKYVSPHKLGIVKEEENLLYSSLREFVPLLAERFRFNNPQQAEVFANLELIVDNLATNEVAQEYINHNIVAAFVKAQSYFESYAEAAGKLVKQRISETQKFTAERIQQQVAFTKVKILLNYYKALQNSIVNSTIFHTTESYRFINDSNFKGKNESPLEHLIEIMVNAVSQPTLEVLLSCLNRLQSLVMGGGLGQSPNQEQIVPEEIGYVLQLALDTFLIQQNCYDALKHLNFNDKVKTAITLLRFELLKKLPYFVEKYDLQVLDKSSTADHHPSGHDPYRLSLIQPALRLEKSQDNERTVPVTVQVNSINIEFKDFDITKVKVDDEFLKYILQEELTADGKGLSSTLFEAEMYLIWQMTLPYGQAYNLIKFVEKHVELDTDFYHRQPELVESLIRFKQLNFKFYEKYLMFITHQVLIQDINAVEYAQSLELLRNYILRSLVAGRSVTDFELIFDYLLSWNIYRPDALEFFLVEVLSPSDALIDDLTHVKNLLALNVSHSYINLYFVDQISYHQELSYLQTKITSTVSPYLYSEKPADKLAANPEDLTQLQELVYNFGAKACRELVLFEFRELHNLSKKEFSAEFFIEVTQKILDNFSNNVNDSYRLDFRAKALSRQINNQFTPMVSECDEIIRAKEQYMLGLVNEYFPNTEEASERFLEQYLNYHADRQGKDLYTKSETKDFSDESFVEEPVHANINIDPDTGELITPPTPSKIESDLQLARPEPPLSELEDAIVSEALEEFTHNGLNLDELQLADESDPLATESAEAATAQLAEPSETSLVPPPTVEETKPVFVLPPVNIEAPLAQLQPLNLVATAEDNLEDKASNIISNIQAREKQNQPVANMTPAEALIEFKDENTIEKKPVKLTGLAKEVTERLEEYDKLQSEGFNPALPYLDEEAEQGFAESEAEQVESEKADTTFALAHAQAANALTAEFELYNERQNQAVVEDVEQLEGVVESALDTLAQAHEHYEEESDEDEASQYHSNEPEVPNPELASQAHSLNSVATTTSQVDEYEVAEKAEEAYSVDNAEQAESVETAQDTQVASVPHPEATTEDSDAERAQTAEVATQAPEAETAVQAVAQTQVPDSPQEVNTESELDSAEAEQPIAVAAPAETAIEAEEVAEASDFVDEAEQANLVLNPVEPEPAPSQVSIPVANATGEMRFTGAKQEEPDLSELDIGIHFVDSGRGKLDLFDEEDEDLKEIDTGINYKSYQDLTSQLGNIAEQELIKQRLHNLGSSNEQDVVPVQADVFAQLSQASKLKANVRVPPKEMSLKNPLGAKTELALDNLSDLNNLNLDLSNPLLQPTPESQNSLSIQNLTLLDDSLDPAKLEQAYQQAYDEAYRQAYLEALREAGIDPDSELAAEVMTPPPAPLPESAPAEPTVTIPLVQTLEANLAHPDAEHRNKIALQHHEEVNHNLIPNLWLPSAKLNTEVLVAPSTYEEHILNSISPTSREILKGICDYFESYAPEQVTLVITDKVIDILLEAETVLQINLSKAAIAVLFNFVRFPSLVKFTQDTKRTPNEHNPGFNNILIVKNVTTIYQLFNMLASMFNYRNDNVTKEVLLNLKNLNRK